MTETATTEYALEIRITLNTTDAAEAEARAEKILEAIPVENGEQYVSSEVYAY